jgi:iron(III) transport system ATP-binding protein
MRKRVEGWPYRAIWCMGTAMTKPVTIDRPPNPRGWGLRGTAAATIGARLSFENVSLFFGDIEAVCDVSFDLEPGEIVCLLGPSGCGKSTLLRLAAGVERPQSGRVLLDGYEVAGPQIFVPPEKRNVGLMFQDFALFPHLTILANVSFGLRALERSAARAEARSALRRVGLEQYEASYPHELSGGEQQRVALARAMVPRPTVMLMDEPFSGLDQRLRESVRQETLAILRETRASSMLVTHDPVEAMGMADRILLMRQGRLIQQGRPEALYHRPVDADAARFFCDFNEVAGRVVDGVALSPLGGFPAPGLEPGQPALIMIRPQGIQPAPGLPEGPLGHVTRARFLGDASELLVYFDGLEEPLAVRVAERNAPRPGDSVHFAVDPDDVLVFPARRPGP